jgi:Fe-S cluster assembly protein SufD
MALPQAKQDQLAERIAGLGFAATGWLGGLRAEALARLSAMGLPGKRDEYWRYTDPTSLTAVDAPKATVFDPKDESPAFDAIDALRLVFVDGVFDAAASDDLALSGISIGRAMSMACWKRGGRCRCSGPWRR